MIDECEFLTDHTQDFIDQIDECRQAGFGFVPLVGAGLSAPSGVPIIREVRDYLRKCVAMALGLDHPHAWAPQCANRNTSSEVCRLDFHRFRRWLPGRDEWPHFGDPQLFGRDQVDWEQRLFDVFNEMRQRAVRRDGEFPEMDVFQEASGVSAEWRSLLLFLSRLRLKTPLNGASEETRAIKSDEDNRHLLTLGTPDLDIVDTFFLNVVHGKQPTLGHRMLARLAGPLRINTALTTNFDELLEQAFLETNNVFTVFDVHMDSGLPSYRHLHHKNSLVKLHGGRFGLRADYSLDKPPSDDDLRHFVSYLAAAPIETATWRQRQQTIPAKRHLLVLGVSGDDERIELMIREAAHRLSGFRVFWVAYRDQDRNAAEQMLNRAAPPLRTGEQFAFHVVRHRFVGQLFLQCYQELTRAIPSSSAVFPSTPRLPVPPELVFDQDVFSQPDGADSDEMADGSNIKTDARESGRERDAGSHDEASTSHEDQQALDRLESYKDQLQDRIKEAVSRSRYDKDFRRIVFMHGQKDTFFGASTAAALAFDSELNIGRQCVWVDMDEVSSCNDLFESIVYTVARKAGIVDWMPVLLQTDNSDVSRRYIQAAQLNEIARITNNPNREWILFINARAGAGTNFWATSEYAERRRERPNGWLDVDSDDDEQVPHPAHGDELDPTACSDAVIDLLDRLCGKDCPNVTVVFLCFDDGRFYHAIRRRLPAIPEPVKGDEKCALPGYQDGVKAADIVSKGLEWARGGDHSETNARSQFLYSLCLVNRVRYPAMLWTWPFHDTNRQTPEISERSKQWIHALEQLHVVRRKQGGFIWIHCDIRNELRLRLLDADEMPKSTVKRLKPLTVRIHHGLAEWYHKLFCSSQDPAAAFEVVYHRMVQVAAILEEATLSDRSEYTRDEKRDRSAILAALSNARQVLEIAHGTMLSAGSSNALCRRLQQIRSVHLDQLETLLAASPWTVIPVGFHEIRHRIHLIRMLSFHLNRSLAREVGENVVAFQRHRELRAWKVVFDDFRITNEDTKDTLGNLYLEQCEEIRRLLKEASVTDIAISLEKSESVRDALTKARLKANCTIYNYTPPESSGKFTDDDIGPALAPEAPRLWIESNNILGTLGIAIRSFDFSTAKFKRVFDLVRMPEDLWPADRNPGDFEVDSADENDPFRDMFDSRRKRRSQFRRWLREELPKRCTALTGHAAGKRRHADAMRQILFGLTKTFQRSQQHLQARGHVYLALSRRMVTVGPATDATPFTEKLAGPDQIWLAARECFDRARWCFELVREVMRHVHRDEERFAVQQKNGYVPNDVWMYWYEDRQRIETLEALPLAFAGDFQRAKRRLNEAEATLSELHCDENSLERAIIDLHRAEVLTQEATARLSDTANCLPEVRATDRPGPNSSDQTLKFRFPTHPGLSELRDPILASIHESQSKRCLAETLRALKEGLKPVADHAFDTAGFFQRIRESVAHMDDAWQTLLRAERLLKQHRKNVWWTTWFFELQLKLVELQLFARLFERCVVLHRMETTGSPGGAVDTSTSKFHIDGIDFERLPFLGLDAVPHGTPTIADRLLDSAERMVRLDLFRISRISESYANCLLALAFWRESLDRDSMSSDWEELGRRQKEMRSRLQRVRESLGKRVERREELDEQWSRTSLDIHVHEYVGFVRRHILYVEDLALQGMWPFENEAAENSDA